MEQFPLVVVRRYCRTGGGRVACVVLAVSVWLANGGMRTWAASGPYSSAPGVEVATFPPRGKKLVAALARAESAWHALAGKSLSPGALAEAEARYAEATGEVIANLNGASKAVLPDGVPPWDWHRAGCTLVLGGYRLVLATEKNTPGAWSSGTFDEAWWVNKPTKNPTVPSALRPGIGATLLAVREGTAERRATEPGLPRRGYYLPATAILEFGPHGHGGPGAPTDVRVKILDPRAVATIHVGARRDLPLAADLATPARQEVGVRNFGWLSLAGFFRPERALEYSGMFFFEPYRADKIPVVFIHGLNSDPSIWENATAELMADPEIACRCQFWYFFYPTGSPVPSSAERLRDSLNKIHAQYDPAGTNPNMNRMVLVGHSMGGLLAHLQVIDPGTQIYDAYFAVPPERLRVPPDFEALLRRNLLFVPRRDVGQVVFVCTPHRGSRLADWGIVRLLAKLVSVPQQVLSAATQILTLNTDLLSPEMRRSGLRGLSSLDSLSPRNPYYAVLEKLPIQRPFDTILGDRGRGDSPHSSDGVVGYESAHWDGARSETIVPYGHQCAMTPLVCGKLHEIVRRDVVQDPAGEERVKIQEPKNPRKVQGARFKVQTDRQR